MVLLSSGCVQECILLCADVFAHVDARGQSTLKQCLTLCDQSLSYSFLLALHMQVVMEQRRAERDLSTLEHCHTPELDHEVRSTVAFCQQRLF